MKKVVKQKQVHEITTIGNFDANKLYFCKTFTGLHKLHKINLLWTFVSMDNSQTTSTGCYSEVTIAIEDQMQFGDVYEFDTLEEAMREML